MIGTRKSRKEDVPASVQSVPLHAAVGGDVGSVTIKVDLAAVLGEWLVVAGWRSYPVDIGVAQDSDRLEGRCFASQRPDVNAHLGMDGTADTGFVLLARCINSVHRPVALQIKGGREVHFELHPSLWSNVDRALLAIAEPALEALCELLPPLTEDWWAVVSALPGSGDAPTSCMGHLDAGAASAVSGTAVVTGWLAGPDKTVAWLETADGRVHGLGNAFRCRRPDVQAAVASSFTAAAVEQVGFVDVLQSSMPEQTIKLKALTRGRVIALSELKLAAMAQEPVGAAKWIFGLVPETGAMQEYFQRIALPVLEELQSHAAKSWGSLPIRTQRYGAVPEAPQASVIVPLYGRADFAEHQLMEFARDSWFVEHVELIYVLDDPRLLDSFPATAERLWQLYRVPFRWVWGGVNRGFSGANNLGMAHSRGHSLVFLNSDVFPTAVGWVQQLLHTLKEREDVGAVGARLVFADGSLQHAGMEFRRREDLGIWINHHPHMGLDPALDPLQVAGEVPAVTGACLAMRREDLERIGGWDTGYLVGDFEDSDLCLKLRSEGKRIIYEPSVILVHLERQSFKLLGEGDFRTRVTVLNAMRHQNRWQSLIEAVDHG